MSGNQNWAPYKTERGLNGFSFTDFADKVCTLQEASTATTDCVWLGRAGKRLLLTRIMANDLIYRLEKFVNTGSL